MSTVIREERRVRLVDDDRADAIELSRAMRELSLDAAVDVVRDVEWAIAGLGTVPPSHLVVVATLAAEPDGALGRLLDEPALRAVPLVLAPRAGATLDVTRALAKGADGYISTTSRRHDLWALLANTQLYWSARPRARHPASRVAIGERIVLVVEPDARRATQLVRALEREGLGPPALVTTGEDAVRWAGEHSVDFCLLAYRAPGIDGIETLIGLRQRRPAWPDGSSRRRSARSCRAAR